MVTAARVFGDQVGSAAPVFLAFTPGEWRAWFDQMGSALVDKARN